MPRIQNSYNKKIFFAFIIIFATIIFSLFNIFTLILTCSEYYCYYKKCKKYNFHNKMEYFFDKTDNLIDWIILDIFSLGIYFSLIMSILLMRLCYKKIMHFYTNYKNRNIDNNPNINSKNLNNIFEPRESENYEFTEELESEERDPLLNV